MEGSQIDQAAMQVKGIPWQPITRHISHALPIALPPAAGTTTAPDAEALEDEEKEEHPIWQKMVRM